MPVRPILHTNQKTSFDHPAAGESKEVFLPSGWQCVVRAFADQIGRDPGIVLGRLQHDGLVKHDDWTLKPLRHKYKVKTSYAKNK